MSYFEWSTLYAKQTEHTTKEIETNRQAVHISALNLKENILGETDRDYQRIN